MAFHIRVMFEFHFPFMLYPICLLSLFTSSFLSLILLGLFVYLWQKGREYCHFYFLCTFVGGESHRGDAYIKGRRHLFMRKPYFVCFTLCLFSHCLWSIELYLVPMLCCSHRIVFMCWTCIHPFAIVLYWLHVRMIICFAIWSF